MHYVVNQILLRSGKILQTSGMVEIDSKLVEWSQFVEPQATEATPITTNVKCLFNKEQIQSLLVLVAQLG